MEQKHFQDWLNLLAVAQKGPVTLPVAVRGQAYSHSLSVSGDMTAATLTGEIRASPDAGSALAVFAIGSPSFADGKTTWAFSLAAGSGANSTGVLPADTDGNGVEYLPYDFLLNAERLFGGLFPLSGHITEPA